MSLAKFFTMQVPCYFETLFLGKYRKVACWKTVLHIADQYLKKCSMY